MDIFRTKHRIELGEGRVSTLSVRRGWTWRRVRFERDGVEIARADKEDLRGGIELPLGDGSPVIARFEEWPGALGDGLSLERDGRPLPGSFSDPGTHRNRLWSFAGLGVGLSLLPNLRTPADLVAVHAWAGSLPTSRPIYLVAVLLGLALWILATQLTTRGRFRFGYHLAGAGVLLQALTAALLEAGFGVSTFEFAVLVMFILWASSAQNLRQALNPRARGEAASR